MKIGRFISMDILKGVSHYECRVSLYLFCIRHFRETLPLENLSTRLAYSR